MKELINHVFTDDIKDGIKKYLKYRTPIANDKLDIAAECYFDMIKLYDFFVTFIDNAETEETRSVSLNIFNTMLGWARDKYSKYLFFPFVANMAENDIFDHDKEWILIDGLVDRVEMHRRDVDKFCRAYGISKCGISEELLIEKIDSMMTEIITSTPYDDIINPAVFTTIVKGYIKETFPVRSSYE